MTEYFAIGMYTITTETLNKYFEDGWEYVGGFSQSVSTAGGNYNHSKTGEILIILKRNKIEL